MSIFKYMANVLCNLGIHNTRLSNRHLDNINNVQKNRCIGQRVHISLIIIFINEKIWLRKLLQNGILYYFSPFPFLQELDLFPILF